MLRLIDILRQIRPLNFVDPRKRRDRLEEGSPNLPSSGVINACPKCLCPSLHVKIATPVERNRCQSTDALSSVYDDVQENGIDLLEDEESTNMLTKEIEELKIEANSEFFQGCDADPNLPVDEIKNIDKPDIGFDVKRIHSSLSIESDEESSSQSFLSAKDMQEAQPQKNPEETCLCSCHSKVIDDALETPENYLLETSSHLNDEHSTKYEEGVIIPEIHRNGNLDDTSLNEGTMVFEENISNGLEEIGSLGNEDVIKIDDKEDRILKTEDDDSVKVAETTKTEHKDNEKDESGNDVLTAPIMQLMPPKYRKKREEVRERVKVHNPEDPDSVCALIFVKDRTTAKIIYRLLKV